LKRILILTAGFGEGHNTAAKNIASALEILAGNEVQTETVDLFDNCYGKFNDFLRGAYVSTINNAPRLWNQFYSFIDKTSMIGAQSRGFARLKNALEDLLSDYEPDAVVCVYPIYTMLVEAIFADKTRKRNFCLITVITDSLTINSLWYRGQSDYYVVPNALTGEILEKVGIQKEKVLNFGFPVTPDFTINKAEPLPLPETGTRKKILYMLNSGVKQVDRIIPRLLEHGDYDLTIVAGKKAKIKTAVELLVKDYRPRVAVLGWTNQIPRLLQTHHVVITKAGGATVQEALAGECPILVSQVVPGQEEGNAELIERLNVGAVADKPSRVVDWLERLFKNDAVLWKLWKENLSKNARPDAALQIAQFILHHAEEVPRDEKIQQLTPVPSAIVPVQRISGKKLLLCDFHMHTRYSDGKLSVSDLIDFYGTRGFDCICVTDHIADYTRFLGKLAKISNLVIPQDQINEYFEELEKQRERAWRKYNMLVMTGLEFNKDGLTRKTSAHLLGIDLKQPIDPGLSIMDTIHQIHAQGGLAIAAHPHVFKSAWGKNTLYLWENQDRYAPVIDAWEIANRDDIFNPVGLKKLPLVANSDFHKPRHIYSWKTMLFCEKEPEAIKACIRENIDVSLTLYRDDRFPVEKKNLEKALIEGNPIPKVCDREEFSALG